MGTHALSVLDCSAGAQPRGRQMGNWRATVCGPRAQNCRKCPQQKFLQNSYSHSTGQLIGLMESAFAQGASNLSSLATTPEESRYAKINWLTCIVLVIFHVLAVVALFQFTWTNLIVAGVLYWVAVGLGISMGYHRLH